MSITETALEMFCTSARREDSVRPGAARIVPHLLHTDHVTGSGEHEPTHQARDLTVLQVKFPAEWVGNTELHVVE